MLTHPHHALHAARTGRTPRTATVHGHDLGLQELEPRLLLTTAPLGVNLEAVADFSRSYMFADAMKAARHFGTTASPWDEAAPVDEHGWPVGDAGVTVLMIESPGPVPIHIDGTYHLSATGRVNVEPVVSNAYVTHWQYDEGTDTTTADVVVLPGATALHLNFSGDPDGAKNIQLMRPGTVPGQVFTDEFLQSLEGAQTLRLMDFTRTNSTEVAEWKDRAKLTDARQSDPGKGAAWEYAIALANETDKDLWVNVPAAASDDYVRQMAALFHSTLEPGRHIYLEYSNELWNSSFWRQFWTNYGKAQEDVAANPTDLNYDNADNPYQFAWRRAAKRLIEIRDIFAEAYGRDAINSTLRPVLASQIAWAYVLNDQVAYLQHRYGLDLSNEIYAVAGAPYLSLSSTLRESPTLTVDQVFEGLYQDLANVQAMVQKSEALAAASRLKLLLYESGIDIQGDIDGNFATAKLPANYDPRMEDLIRTYLLSMFSNGVDGIVYYGHISAYTPWGTWGLTDTVQNLDAPKMLAFREVAGMELPAVTSGIALPPAGAESIAAGNYLMDYWASTGPGGAILGAGPGAPYTYLLKVATPADYALQLSVASGPGGGAVEVYIDGASMGVVQLPPTADGTTYVNTAPVMLAPSGTTLGEGHHALRLRVVSGTINLQTLTIGTGGYALPYPPPAPKNLAMAGRTSVQVHLTWAEVAGATGYKVERSTDGTTWTQVALLAAGIAAYTDTGLSPGTPFSYRVRATNGAGDSLYSAMVTTTTLLPAPTKLAATSQGKSSIQLTWSPVAGAGSYLIQRSLNGKTWTSITRVSRSTTSFTDYGLSEKTSYTYRIYAVALDGTLSEVSSPVTEKTLKK
jgi:hypothetical protein